MLYLHCIGYTRYLVMQLKGIAKTVRSLNTLIWCCTSVSRILRNAQKKKWRILLKHESFVTMISNRRSNCNIKCSQSFFTFAKVCTSQLKELTIREMQDDCWLWGQKTYAHTYRSKVIIDRCLRFVQCLWSSNVDKLARLNWLRWYPR